MKIAQVAPLFESVPPKLYGGTERVVSYLTEELVKMGHEVTLYASGDSVTRGRLKAQVPKSLRLDKTSIDHIAHHIVMAERVAQDAEEYDIIHSHIDYLPYSLYRRKTVPDITTLHGRLDMLDLIPVYKEFSDRPVISISNSQRSPFPTINWQGTVYHGLPEGLLSYHEKPGKYLAYLGRMSPEKRPDIAIQIAKSARIPLKIAAKISDVDEEYFKESILPLLEDPLIEYIGEINESEKDEFLGNALGLLFPIHWPEPFGLVMIEAMACGTPVIARRSGSVPEIMEEGRSGFIFEEIEEAVRAVEKLKNFDRQKCREVFERRFTASRMAQDYIQIYKQFLEEKADVLKAG